MELQVVKLLNIDSMPGYLQRRMTSPQDSDPHAMHVPAQRFAKGHILTRIDNLLQAIRVMYIMESAAVSGTKMSIKQTANNEQASGGAFAFTRFQLPAYYYKHTLKLYLEQRKHKMKSPWVFLKTTGLPVNCIDYSYA